MLAVVFVRVSLDCNILIYSLLVR